ncbi:hypothetical protein IHQ71_00300 [Rhizobium sp. TH2]|uniref:hypothetical protein n=1 Tax=Rhizobium sp. TH2 TaxID=2775403 RepID=UPI002157F9C4|nr:hypothetical protein [Rhizobium sp. TH2]UVC09116.1 hypothetical protein IHQ71_00300 [Rhizobium sp. TH2]
MLEFDYHRLATDDRYRQTIIAGFDRAIVFFGKYGFHCEMIEFRRVKKVIKAMFDEDTS